jgi:hypothetical protein
MSVLDFFRGGTVPREIRLLTANGGVSLRGVEQFALLILLAEDPDGEVAAAARSTLAALTPASCAEMVAADEIPADVRGYIASRGWTDTVQALTASARELKKTETAADPGTHESIDRRPIATLPVAERFKLAVFGSREQRAQLVRDPNKLVALAVLSSPRLTEPEVENIARMSAVVEEVLRAISANRRWMRNYKVMSAIAHNAKTPPGIAMHLIAHLHPRDVQMLAMDRNLSEVVRLAARKALMKGKKA